MRDSRKAIDKKRNKVERQEMVVEDKMQEAETARGLLWACSHK